MDLKDLVYESVDWIKLVLAGHWWRALVDAAVNFQVPQNVANYTVFLGILSNYVSQDRGRFYMELVACMKNVITAAQYLCAAAVNLSAHFGTTYKQTNNKQIWRLLKSHFGLNFMSLLRSLCETGTSTQELDARNAFISRCCEACYHQAVDLNQSSSLRLATVTGQGCNTTG